MKIVLKVLLPLGILFVLTSPLDAADMLVQKLKGYLTDKPVYASGPADGGQSEQLAIIRTALYNYAVTKGQFPDSLDELTSSFPNNYLSYIPVDASGSNKMVEKPDGTGGWVYKKPDSFHIWDAERDIETILYPNDGTSSRIPFVPLQLSVLKKEHKIVLHAGETVYETFPIADGKDDATPEGQFFIGKKVVNPNFHLANTTKPYGTRGMELSDPKYAIHGTYEEESIGTSVSKGCVRLAIANMEKLYDKVPLYTTVFMQDEQKDHLLQTRPLPVLLYQNEANANKVVNAQSGADGNECHCAKDKGKKKETDNETVYHWAG